MQIAYRPRAEEALSGQNYVALLPLLLMQHFYCFFVFLRGLIKPKTWDTNSTEWFMALRIRPTRRTHFFKRIFVFVYFCSILPVVWNKARTTRWLARRQVWPPPLRHHPHWCHHCEFSKVAFRPQLLPREAHVPWPLDLMCNRNW